MFRLRCKLHLKCCQSTLNGRASRQGLVKVRAMRAVIQRVKSASVTVRLSNFSICCRFHPLHETAMEY